MSSEVGYIQVPEEGMRTVVDEGSSVDIIYTGTPPYTQPHMLVAGLNVCLAQQEERYGHGEEPPVPVRQQPPYNGPPLRYLMDNRQVIFCTTRAEVLHYYQTVPNATANAPGGHHCHPVPEYAALIQGGSGISGIVRARINTTAQAPSAITRAVADRLGLQVRPVRGPGAMCILGGNRTLPLGVLAEPLIVQVLCGPAGTVAMGIALAVVVVIPSRGTAPGEVFMLQLGMFDFCQAVEIDQVPLWASQFKDRTSGYRFAVPVVAPKPPHAQVLSSSTFGLLPETFHEVWWLVSGQKWQLHPFPKEIIAAAFVLRSLQTSWKVAVCAW
eukprot:gene5614-5852_t